MEYRKHTKTGKPGRRLLYWGDLFERGLIKSKGQARMAWKRGLFPPPLHLGTRTLAWDEDTMDGWVASRRHDWEPPQEAA
jgi:hypothetical protein